MRGKAAAGGPVGEVAAGGPGGPTFACGQTGYFSFGRVWVQESDRHKSTWGHCAGVAHFHVELNL